jgi:hypothetical protein
MKILGTRRRNVVFATVGTMAAIGIGGTAYATTVPSSSSPSPSTALPAPSTAALSTVKADRARTLLARADHATVEIKLRGNWVTYTIDRGQVTATTSTSITLARPDGQHVTDTINSGTKFNGITSASGITVGQKAVAISNDGVAVRISQKAATS